MEGKEFKKLRRYHLYTQQQVATYCNVSKVAISRWENDKLIISYYLLNKIDDFANKFLSI